MTPPIIATRDGLPVYDGADIQPMFLLFGDDSPRIPCWIKCGSGSHRITKENILDDSFRRGLWIAVEMIAARRERE